MIEHSQRSLRFYVLVDWNTKHASKGVRLTTNEVKIFNRAYAQNGYSLRYVPV